MGKTLLAALLALSALPAAAALTGTTIVKPRSSSTITLIPLVSGTVGTADTIRYIAKASGVDTLIVSHDYCLAGARCADTLYARVLQALSQPRHVGLREKQARMLSARQRA